MSTRPISLLGSEAHLRSARPSEEPVLHFDGEIGVWRDPSGQLLIDIVGGPGTTKSATGEGIDQIEVSGPSTQLTETREGIDQSEAIGHHDPGDYPPR